MHFNKSTLAVAACMAVISISSCTPGKQNGKQTPSTAESAYLDSLESLFAGVPQWLTTTYDSASGGFYDNALMVKDPKYGPDLQSTAFSLHILFEGNILSRDSLSEAFKNGLASYVKTRYDESTGYYLDAPYREKILKSERTLARTQGMASGILNKIGVKDQRTETISDAQTPEYLRSLPQFEKWLKNQQWDRVWTAFDHIAMQGAFIRRLPTARADSIVHFIQDYAAKVQDDDGLWGKGQPMEVRFSGAAKYGTFCMNMKLPMPQPDTMYATVMHWFRTNKDLDFTDVSGCPICVPRNALRLLFYIKPQLTVKMSPADRALIARRTLEMLRFYHRPDGGFMKTQTASVIAPDDINLGQYDELVSDMNGTNLAITARAGLYDLLDKPVPRIPAKRETISVFGHR